MTQRATPGQDGHLVHRRGVRQRPGDQRVPTLVVRGDLLLLVAHHPGPALRTGDHPVDRLLQGVVGDRPLLLTGGEQRGLVDHVGQVGAAEARGTPGDRVEVDVGRERLALGVHPQDGLAALHVGGVDRDLPVEPARAQQRRVEDVRPVGGGDQDHAALGVEAVHLDQKLVERLLPLVVAAAHAGATVAADRVDLVDEDDRRGVRLGLLEQVADTAGADADEHLDEVGAGDGVEGHPGLAGDRAGQQRLAGSGRAEQQHALRDLGAEGLVLRRVLQEVLDLVQFLDGLLGPGHVREGGLRRVLGDHLRLGLAEVEHPRAATLHLRHEEQQQEHEKRDGKQVDQQADPDAVRRHLGVDRAGDPVRRLGLADLVPDLAADLVRELRLDLVGGGVVAELGLVLQVELERLLLVLEDDLLDAALVELVERDGSVHPVVAGTSGEQLTEHDGAEDDQDDPDHRSAEETRTFHAVVGCRGARILLIDVLTV